MPDTGDDEAARREREATEWFFRRDGGFTGADESAFRRWLRADVRHSGALAEIERTWQQAGAARDLVTASGALSEAHAVEVPARRPWRSIALAAAAAVAVGFAGWQATKTFSARPGEARDAGQVFAETTATESDGLRRMELPDGSSVTLNADSAVEVQFTFNERRVRLQRGEAHFTVAKNPHRPFVVEAHGVAVKAVGTAFNVRLGADAVEVLVTEGKVRVDDAARGLSLLTSAGATATRETAAVMNPGDKAVIAVKAEAAPAAAAMAVLSTREIEAALAWQKRSLDYTDAPLAEIVADFNRYNQHRLVIADATLARRRFGGTFPAGDYRSLVQVLEETFDVVAERRERETVLRLR
jgi:transmembrane sensor